MITWPLTPWVLISRVANHDVYSRHIGEILQKCKIQARFKKLKFKPKFTLSCFKPLRLAERFLTANQKQAYLAQVSFRYNFCLLRSDPGNQFDRFRQSPPDLVKLESIWSACTRTGHFLSKVVLRKQKCPDVQNFFSMKKKKKKRNRSNRSFSN